MDEPTGIRTVALECPECGEKIHPPRGDVAFSCARCRAASEVSGGRLVSVACSWPAPDSRLRLPFWCFEVDVSYSADDADAVALLGRLVRPDRVYVPAFRQRSVILFGDMGLALTFSPPAMEEGEPGRFSGATLGSAEALRLVEPMILWRADQVHDVTGIDVRASVADRRLVAIPARDDGGRIEMLPLGRSWPAAAFLDLGALRWLATCDRL